jgi:hypothetical protein
VFLIVTVCGTEVVPTFVAAKVRLLGVRETVCNGIPVPVSGTVCGELDALSVATRLAVAAPAAIGSNAIVSVQLAPAASEVEQVLAVNEKSLALLPVKV